MEKVKRECKKYFQEREWESPRIQIKVKHMYRVAENSKKIAKALSLTEEEIKLAELIGLLHDIGRFEQYQIKTREEREKFDHGKAGVRILKKDNNIRKYINESQYDDIIYTAIEEHNQYTLTKGLSKDKEQFAKIIKDADKMDLLYEANYVYWQEKERIKQIEQGRLSEKMLEDFYQRRLANTKNRISQTDQILRYASYVFDFHFSYSLKIVKEKDYISKMIDRFSYQIPKTKEEMAKVKNIANEYLKNNV